jgi:hypothetical protein
MMLEAVHMQLRLYQNILSLIYLASNKNVTEQRTI